MTLHDMVNDYLRRQDGWTEHPEHVGTHLQWEDATAVEGHRRVGWPAAHQRDGRRNRLQRGSPSRLRALPKEAAMSLPNNCPKSPTGYHAVWNTPHSCHCIHCGERVR